MSPEPRSAPERPESGPARGDTSAPSGSRDCTRTTLRDLVAPLRRRSVGILALVLLLSYAYFVSRPAWNQNSRLALTRALVERGASDIDPDHVTTGDKSFRDGHFYSDKAPGASWVATLPYTVFHALRSATGRPLPDVRVHPLDPLQVASGVEIEPEDREPGDRLVYNNAHRIALYVCGLFAVAIPSVAGAGALYLLAFAAFDRRHRPAALLTLAYALGTPAFVYSTALYGHQLCASLLLIAFALLALPSSSKPPTPLTLFAAGTSMGLAVATEYPAAPVVALLWVWSGLRHGKSAWLWVTLGGVPWAIALALYHTVAFGSPLKTGYDFVYRAEFAEGMAVNYGIGMPDPAVLLSITFGAYRGLFYLSPVLLLAVWGLLRQSATRHVLARPLGRAASILSTFILTYFLLLNAGYYMWDGGAAVGPRHVVPALPFLALGLVAPLRRVPWVFCVLGVLSVAQLTLATAASPEAAQWGNPLWEFALDRLVHQEVGLTGGPTNLGALLGLPGVWSLLPLLALWVWAWPATREA